jgi:hypothetical protein
MQEFNKNVLETMQKEVGQIKSVYEVCKYCKDGNNIANKEYLKKFPTHKDLLSILERSVSLLEQSILNDYDQFLVENLLSDIEFIIGQNVLTEEHIQRQLLGPITIQKFPIFKKKTENIQYKLLELYNCESNRYYFKYNEEKANQPFNYQQLSSYLRYNKIGYEEALINSDTNGDYIIESYNIDLDKAVTESIDKRVQKNYVVEKINIIDKFKLEQHGFGPILESNNQFVHYKNGKQYNLYKYNDYYYMISESKSYKIIVKEKSVDIALESLFDVRVNWKGVY